MSGRQNNFSCFGRRPLGGLGSAHGWCGVDGFCGFHFRQRSVQLRDQLEAWARTTLTAGELAQPRILQVVARTNIGVLPLEPVKAGTDGRDRVV